MTGLIWIIDGIARETMLFAAVGLLVGGVDDLAIDALFLLRRWWRRRAPRWHLDRLPSPAVPGRLAVFVPTWDEAGVIGAMLGTALSRFDHPDYRIYVGTYANDRPTIDEVARVAERDARIRLVISAHPGPTTKADCLNALWRAMLRDDAGQGLRTKAVVLHDAEDVVHAAELTIYDALIGGYDVVQLPVLPLVKSSSRLVSGHYADEFAEAHTKQLVVRTALGAGMPLAGVGCAIAVPMLEQVAAARNGDPFDKASLTEDYELGLRVAELGGRGAFARVDERGTGHVVAVRAYFPDSLSTAVRQKARWMVGIALAGWDRTGWSRWHAVSDHWMRMRDRRAMLAVLVLATSYVALVAWGVAFALHRWTGQPVPGPIEGAGWLLAVNAGLLLWRLAMRVACTTRCYGWREGAWALPRFAVGNFVALLAAPRALIRYLRLLAGAPTYWDKTRHEFPDLATPDAA